MEFPISPRLIMLLAKFPISINGGIICPVAQIKNSVILDHSTSLTSFNLGWLVPPSNYTLNSINFSSFPVPVPLCKPLSPPTQTTATAPELLSLLLLLHHCSLCSILQNDLFTYLFNMK